MSPFCSFGWSNSMLINFPGRWGIVWWEWRDRTREDQNTETISSTAAVHYKWSCRISSGPTGCGTTVYCRIIMGQIPVFAGVCDLQQVCSCCFQMPWNIDQLQNSGVKAERDKTCACHRATTSLGFVRTCPDEKHNCFTLSLCWHTVHGEW